MLSQKQKTEKLFDTIILVLLVILVVGIPLIFTSYTRSVFEVNKMLLLRICTLMVCGVWLFKYLLFKDNGYDNPSEKSICFFGFRWQKIGLEWPIAIWFILNVLSTIFSQNVRISIIGAYDRWEGILTITNYIVLWLMIAKLVSKRFQFYTLLWAILVPTAISCVYGVFQSFGLDFMNWSVNPTQRVFACINNPVHFCAYVAMTVPLGISLLLYLSSPNTLPSVSHSLKKLMKYGAFFLTILIYYAQFLSFSKATWLGFAASMSLFYILVSELFFDRTKKLLLIDFFFTAISIASFYLLFLFDVYKKSLVLTLILSSILLAYWIFNHFLVFKTFKNNTKQLVFSALFSVCIFLAFVLNVESLLGNWAYLFLLLISPVVLWLSLSKNLQFKHINSKILIIILFANLQFVAISFYSILAYIVLLFSFLFLTKEQTDEPDLALNEKKTWLVSFLFVFGLIIIIPTLPSHLAKVFSFKTETLSAVNNVTKKVSSYGNDAQKENARMSMFKSSFPWIKDYWLLGTGPDTIKYMYPVYRRADYGILEGGHNFTPDRLHNEYLNTLATRGIPATLVYYVGMILGWFVLVLSGIYTMKHNPLKYFASACLASAGIYLGQVFFNFGVVATMVLFYVLVGLGHAIVAHKEIYQEEPRS